MACVAPVYCRSNFFLYLSLTMRGKIGPLLDEMVSYNPRCCAPSSQCVPKGKDKNGFFSWVHGVHFMAASMASRIVSSFWVIGQ
jgi:hypothetical protein